MKKQNFEIKNDKIKEAFLKLKKENPERLKKRLNFSWSNWGFGIEPFEQSAARLAKYGISYIELHGNHYGDDLGYKPKEILPVLGHYGIKVGGICGMFSEANEFASNKHLSRQAAIDYVKRETEFCEAVGASYMLVVPAAVGRPNKYDDNELERSVDGILRVADLFVKHNVKAAVEPIRSAEVSIVHTFEDAKEYIKMVNHPGVQHINGDVYHMQVEESHIGEAIVNAGDMLTNLHLADSNRCALGDGFMDYDTIIMSLYLIGYNQEGKYCTPEPLGPGGNPYPATFGKPDPALLDKLVGDSVKYFREREEELING